CASGSGGLFSRNNAINARSFSENSPPGGCSNPIKIFCSFSVLLTLRFRASEVRDIIFPPGHHGTHPARSKVIFLLRTSRRQSLCEAQHRKDILSQASLRRERFPHSPATDFSTRRSVTPPREPALVSYSAIPRGLEKRGSLPSRARVPAAFHRQAVRAWIVSLWR